MSYRYETHLHTCQASACGRSTGAEHVRWYKALGYDGIFVTDHFFGGNCAVDRSLPWAEKVRRFCAGYRDAKAEGDRIGLQVFFAWEETMDGDDYLVYGCDEDWLLTHPGIEHATRRQQLALVHAAGGCVVQAHPFRMRDYMRRIHLGGLYCDAVEAANAGNRAFEDVCAMNYARWLGKPVTCGSDNHESGFGKRDPAVTWGVETETRITCPGDYVRMILSGEPVGLLCPPERLVLQPDMALRDECYWLDGAERDVPTGVDWLRGPLPAAPGEGQA